LKNLSRDELYPGMASKRPSRIEIVEWGNCEMEFLSVRNKEKKTSPKL
jgi:hypothetical protein